MTKPVKLEDAKHVPMDTLTPDGIYFRPYDGPAADLLAKPGEPFPGDFFSVTHQGINGAPRASLLSWAAPADGNIYPIGDHGVAGQSFDPRTLSGQWYPFGFTSTWLDGALDKVREAVGHLEDVGQLIGILQGLDSATGEHADDLRARAAADLRPLRFRVEAFLREAKILLSRVLP